MMRRVMKTAIRTAGSALNEPFWSLAGVGRRGSVGSEETILTYLWITQGFLYCRLASVGKRMGREKIKGFCERLVQFSSFCPP